MSTQAPRIEKITVYPSGCTITRVVRVKTTSGINTHKLGPLPTPLDEDSVNVSGQGQKKFLIKGVDVKREVVKEQVSSEELQKLQDALEDLQEKKTLIEEELRGLEERRDLTKVITGNLGEQFPREFAKGRTEGERLIQFLHLLGERRQQWSDEIQKVRKNLKEVQNEINVTKDKLRSVGLGGRTTTQVFVEVMLEVKEEAEILLRVRYNTPNASWHPSYDLRLLEEDQLIAEYNANVVQRTGESWENVALSMSTARPLQVSEVPTLETQWVSIYSPPLPKRDRSTLKAKRMSRPPPAPPSAPMAMSAPMREEEEAEAYMEAELEEASYETAELTEAVVFTVASPQTILSNEEPKKVLMVQEELQFKRFYKAVPRETNDVYQLAEVTNTSNVVLLPGVARVYSGSEFVGSTRMDKRAPTETFTLTLGVVDSISVERKLKEKKLEKKGTLSKSQKETHTYVITCKNHRTTESHLRIIDQIPVSNSSEIALELLEVSPEVHKKSELNILEWRLHLKPNEKKKITFGFRIEYPFGKKVVGLE